MAFRVGGLLPHSSTKSSRKGAVGRWRCGGTALGKKTFPKRLFRGSGDNRRASDFFVTDPPNPDPIGYGWSRDGGRTWRSSRIFAPLQRGRTDPAVAADATGHFAWPDARRGDPDVYTRAVDLDDLPAPAR